MLLLTSEGAEDRKQSVISERVQRKVVTKHQYIIVKLQAISKRLSKRCRDKSKQEGQKQSKDNSKERANNDALLAGPK